MYKTHKGGACSSRFNARSNVFAHCFTNKVGDGALDVPHFTYVKPRPMPTGRHPRAKRRSWAQNCVSTSRVLLIRLTGSTPSPLEKAFGLFAFRTGRRGRRPLPRKVLFACRARFFGRYAPSRMTRGKYVCTSSWLPLTRGLPTQSGGGEIQKEK